MAFGTVSGTFQGTNASIPASFASALSTGSGVVNIGDIVVCLVTEQTALTVTSVTDSQGNTYTAQNAGTLSGANVSGRMFWTRITTAGTLTSVTATCTASANDGVIIAAIINGPFLASPVDVNLANAPDLTSPFTAPASGTMAQTTEVVVSWCASTGSAAFTGTSPTTIAIQQASAAVVEGVLGTQVPPSTATVTPTYTGTAPTANELGTISFKGAISELDAAYSQPLSGPVWPKCGLATHLQSFIVYKPFGPPKEDIAKVDRWFAPLSEPVRTMPRLYPSLQDTSAEVYPTPSLTNNKWFTPLSEPVRAARPAQKVNLFPFSATAATVALDWFTSLSEPVRVRTSPAQQQALAFVPVIVQAQVSIDWLAPLSEPVRRKVILTDPQVLAFVQPPDLITGWAVPLSEPTRAKQRAIADYAYAPLAVSEVVTIDKWFNPLAPPLNTNRGLNVALQQAYTTKYFPDATNANAGQWFAPLSEPTRIKRGINATDQGLVPVVTTEVVTVDKWFDAFSEPVLVKSRFSVQQQAYTSGYAEFEIVRWYQPWSEPVRQKQGLSAANQQALGYVAPVVVVASPVSWFGSLSDPVRKIPAAQKVNLFPFTAAAVAESITVDKWFDPLSEPLRAKPALLAALQQVSTQDTVFIPDPSRYEGWYGNLSEPVRQKVGLRAAQQTAFFAYPSVVAAEIVTVDKWFVSLSEPKRLRSALHASLQQTTTQDTVFIPNPANYEGWYGSLSEPQRQQAGLKAAQQVSYSSSYVNVAVEVITVDKWFSSLSSPTKPKPGDYDRYKGENEFTAIAANMKWFAPLTEPVLQKRGLAVTHQTAFFAYPGVIAGEIITIDKWFAPLTEPVRFKPALLTGRQQFLTWPPQIIIPSLASWWRPLAEPPKAKVSLGTHLQRAFTQDPKLFPNPSRFLEGWYNWWAEPVRHPAQLNAALQRSWTASDRRPVLATITVTMAVTEVNDDVALFAIKVFAGNPPATAVVSLVEIGHGASLTSIVEEGDDGSGTSVVES